MHRPLANASLVLIALVTLGQLPVTAQSSAPAAPVVLKGTLESEVDGVKARVPAGSLMYIPADVVHSALATPDEDVIFLTAKDMSHGIVGTPVDQSISAPLYAPGFGPSGAPGAPGEGRR